jgi:hypothetical protein
MISRVPTLQLSVMHKFEFDTVIFNLAEQYKWALRANATSKVFWVLAAEAMYKEPTLPVRALMQDFFFIANSKFTAGYVTDHRQVPYPIPIIPGGINPKHFRNDPEIHKYHHILYYGSARPWKGTQIIENMLKTVKLRALKMEGLNTPQEGMYRLYNQCDMFISAAQCEGFNFPILEAMSCGCPVICTDDGGSRDFVVPGVNAIVVNRNSNDIRKAVITLHKNKSLRRQLRVAGLQTASDPRYKWENVTIQLENALQNFLNK